MRSCILLLGLTCALTTSASARTWHVPGDAPSIQAGIDSAAVGDTVLVACGTYYEHDIRVKSGICLRSADGLADCATIDAQRAGRVLYCVDLDATTLIEGFTITGGQSVESPGPSENGGGMYCANSSPVIRDCLFLGNAAGGDQNEGAGGGLSCVGSSLTLTRVTFSWNGAGGWFAPGSGGGICCTSSSLELTDVDFQGNAAGGECYGAGGGMHCSGSSSLSFSGVTFDGNQAETYGGGLYLEDSDALLSDILFRSNSTGLGGDGGGIHCTECDLSVSSATFIENGGGAGGGITCGDSPAILSHCTFSGNWSYGGEGAAVLCMGAFLTLENVIISASEGAVAVGCWWESPSLTCCDIYGNLGGDWQGCIADQYGVSGNICEDPLFCDPGSGDFTLDCLSPCAAENNPECGQIGAWPVGCGPTPVVETSWGGLKSLFRR